MRHTTKLTDAYEIGSTLFENDSTVIYRARRMEDDLPVILKTHKRKEDLHKIKHEYELLKDRHIPGISNVIDLFDNNDDPAFLVSEDHGAEVLEAFMGSMALGTTEMLTVAENASRALEGIHESHIIHRDIKPANMLINPQTLAIFYIDFGISLAVRRGNDIWQENIEGTLEYLSPEQTGRVHRPIDYRTDIYSLGVTLYRLITGVLPFTGRSAMELIHAHIATAPVPPDELVETEPIVSAGLLKMLEKKPENRYQTASSLTYDIHRCLLLMAQGKDCNNFRLAEKDIFYALEPGRRMYGKRDAMEALQNAYRGINRAHAEVVFLDGGVSSGKSMLLNEFERDVLGQNALLFRTEYEHQERDVPYHALRSLFARFDSLVYGAKISLSAYRERILERLGENTQVLVDILPQMELVLGKQAAVPDVGTLETQTRTRQVFRTFMQILCEVPVPCVFLFDNVQWADEASLRLVFSAMEDRGLNNCLFVFAFRDEDFSEGERLRRYAGQSLRQNHLASIHLHPLGVEDIAGIITDLFPQDAQEVMELAQVVYSYTHGDIRSIETYLKGIYHAGLIAYDEENDRWHWDRDAVNPAGAADMRIKADEVLEGLPPETLHAVHIISCLGPHIPYEYLEIVAPPETTADAMLVALAPLVDEGYLRYDEGAKRLECVNTREQQAAYEHMPLKTRQQYHRLIADRLYGHYEGSEALLIRHCGVICDQYRQVDMQEIEPGQRQRMLHINTLAGGNAMRTANMDMAARCYADAAALLGDEPLRRDYDAAFPLLRDYASCLFAMGERETAGALYDQLAAQARDVHDRYAIFRLRIGQHLAHADWINTAKYAYEYLAGSGLLPDEDGMQTQLETQRRIFRAASEAREIECFVDMPMCEDDQARYNGSMMAVLCEASVTNMNPNALLYLYITLNHAYAYGAFPDLERALASMAERRASLREFAIANRYIQAAFAFAEKHGLPVGVIWAVYSAALAHWVEPLSITQAMFQKVKRVTTAEGNLYYGAFADLMLLEYHLFTGTPLHQVSKDIEAAIYNVEKLGFERFRGVFTSVFRQYVRCMTGRTAGLDTFDDRTFNEAETEAGSDPIRWQFTSQLYYIFRMQSLFINGFYEKAIEYAEKHRQKNQDGTQSMLLSRVQLPYYHSLAMIRLCEQDHTLMEQYMPQIRRNQTELQAYAEAYPENFQMKHDMIEVELTRLMYLDLSLIGSYSKLDLAFRERNCLWDCAIIEETLRDFWMKRGIQQYREVHGRNALERYRELGARIKVMELAGHADSAPEASGLSQTISSTTFLTSTGLSMTTASTYSASLDHQALLNVLSCLVSETNIDDLMSRLLSLLMETGGADQALLFLLQGDELQLRAFQYADRRTQGLMAYELPLALRDLSEDMAPKKLIGLVAGKRTNAVANNAENDFLFLRDAYLEKTRPESFIGLPILVRDKLLGVVYLENAKLPGVFPPSRVSFLDTVMLQSSLLLQNAMGVRELESYTEDLEKQLSSYLGQLNTLIAGIAHEINSPLGVCVTVTSRLLESAHDTARAYGDRQLSKTALEGYFEETQRGLDILSNNVTRASDMVQNFKRISVDQSTEVFDDLELMQSLRSIVQYIRPAVKKIIGDFTIKGPETVQFTTSMGVLAQIFTNLIINSANHAFAGMEKESALVTIEVALDEDAVVIVYSDNGRGMTAEEKEKIFVPFYTTRRAEGGSGLGGHIILTLVTQTLRGAIHCISSPGQGTTFILRLPMLTKAELEGEDDGQQ